MKRFFWRELRRLAPIALGSASLGPLVFAGASIVAAGAFGRSSFGPGVAGFLIVLLVAPYLLSVASTAPDVESGAEAFLVTLPVRRWRELAARWGAALLASLLAIALAAPLLALEPIRSWGVLTSFDVARLAWLAVIAFACGLAASTTIRSTLVALVAAPVFALGPGLAYYGWNRLVLGAPPEDVAKVLAGLPLVLLGAGALAFLRGDVHRASRRPLALATATLGCVVLGLSGFSTATYAYESYVGVWRRTGLDFETPDGRGRFVRLDRERSFEKVPPTTRWTWEGTGVAPVLLADDEKPVAFSPDGKTLVTVRADDESACRIRHLETGAIERREVTPLRALAPFEPQFLWVDGSSLSRASIAGEATRAWLSEPQRASGVLFARGHVGVVREDGVDVGDHVVRFPEGTTRILTSAGPRLVLDVRSRLQVLDLETEEPPADLLDRLPVGLVPLEVALDATGRWLVVVGWSTHGEVWLVDLAARGPGLLVPLVPALEDPSLLGTSIEVSFGPGSKLASVVVSTASRQEKDGNWVVEYKSALVALESATWIAIEDGTCPSKWAPSGRGFLSFDRKEATVHVVEGTTDRIVARLPRGTVSYPLEASFFDRWPELAAPR